MYRLDFTVFRQPFGRFEKVLKKYHLQTASLAHCETINIITSKLLEIKIIKRQQVVNCTVYTLIKLQVVNINANDTIKYFKYIQAIVDVAARTHTFLRIEKSLRSSFVKNLD